MLRKVTSILILLLFQVLSLQAQPICGQPTDTPPGCQLCLPNYSGDLVGYSPSGVASSCMPNDNDAWFNFVAASANATLIVSTGNCSVGASGLAFQVYDTGLNAIAPCQGVNDFPSTQNLSLTPGEQYLIRIMDIDNEGCDFSLQLIGLYIPPPLTAPDPIEANPSGISCPGQEVCYRSGGNGDLFTWTIPPNGSLLSGQGTEEICVRWNGPGGGVICVVATETCNPAPSPPTCLAANVLPIPPTIKAPEYICPSDFPIVRDGLTFRAPGNYQITTSSFRGCDSLVQYTFLLFPQIPTVIDTMIPSGACLTVGSRDYCDPGIYQIVLPGGDVNGCDSLISLNLAILVEDRVMIDDPDTLDCLQACQQISASLSQPNPHLTFSWSTFDGSISGQSDVLNVQVCSPGTYLLEIVDTLSGQTGTISVEVPGVRILPDSLSPISGPDTVCLGEEIKWWVNSDSASLDYFWDIDDWGSVTGVPDTSISIIVDSIPGDSARICVSAVNYCGQSPLQCKTIYFNRGILLDLATPDSFFCSDPCDTLAARLLSPNPNLSFQWSTDTGLIRSGGDTRNPEICLPGSYFLDVTDTLENSSCHFRVPVSGRIALPDSIRQVFWPQTLCPGDTFQFDLSPVMGATAYDWSVSGGTIVEEQMNRIRVVFPDTGSNASVCVQATNTCGPSNQVCRGVQVQNQLTVDFSLPSDICQGDTVLLTYQGNAGAGAIFDWHFSRARIISGSGAGPFELRWDLPGTDTTSLVVESGGCRSDTFRYPVLVNASRPPVINCSSSLEEIRFSWDPVFGATGYDLMVDGQSVSGFSDTTYLLTGLIPGQEVDFSIRAIGPDICGSGQASVNCIAQDCPDVILEVVGDRTYCSGSAPVQFLANVIGGAGMGTLNWSGPAISSDGILDIPALPAGNYTYELEYAESVCLYRNAFSVRILPVPLADFEAPDLLCTDESGILEFNGVADVGADFQWDFDGGSVVSGSGAGPYRVFWSTEGEYHVSLEVTDMGCRSGVHLDTIRVDAPLTPPVVTCISTLSSVTFSWDTVPGALNYQVNLLSGQAGVFSGSFQYVVDGLDPGEEVSLEVIAQGVGVCPPSETIISCRSLDCPQVLLEVLPVSGLCLGDGPLQLEISVSGHQGNGQFSWSGPGVDAMGVFDPSVAGVGQHQIRLEYLENGCSYEASQTIEVTSPPTVSAQEVQPPVFEGQQNGRIRLETAPGSHSFLWDTGDTTRELSGLAGGTYCVSVTNEYGCMSSDCFTLGSALFRVPYFKLLCQGGATRLTVRPSTGAQFQWSPGIGLSCTDCASPVANPVQTTVYTLQVTLGNGTVATTNVFVLVLPPPFCPGNLAPDTNPVDRLAGTELQQYSAGDKEEQVRMPVRGTRPDAKVFPNPARDELILDAGVPIESIRIFNSTGTQVLKSDGSSGPVRQIGISDWPRGLYFVWLETIYGREVLRFLKY